MRDIEALKGRSAVSEKGIGCRNCVDDALSSGDVKFRGTAELRMSMLEHLIRELDFGIETMKRENSNKKS